MSTPVEYLETKLKEAGVQYVKYETASYSEIYINSALPTKNVRANSLFDVTIYVSGYITVYNSPFTKIHDIKTNPYISTHAGYKKCQIAIEDYKSRYPILYALGDKSDRPNNFSWNSGKSNAVDLFDQMVAWAAESSKDIIAKINKVNKAKFKIAISE